MSPANRAERSLIICYELREMRRRLKLGSSAISCRKPLIACTSFANLRKPRNRVKSASLADYAQAVEPRPT
ncbi:unnamed protein product [Ixodes pacificus]